MEMDTRRNLNLTAQGFTESPVPASARVLEQAPTRASSNYCGPSTLGDQGVKGTIATGTTTSGMQTRVHEDNNPDPFRRRESLMRTPPSKSADDDSHQRKKRPREEPSPGTIKRKTEPTKETLELRRLIEQVHEQTRAVASAIAEVPNTKNEIKETFKVLKRLVEKMDRRRKEFEENPIEVECREMYSQTNEGSLRKVARRSIGTQVLEGEVQWTDELNGRLDSSENLDDFGSLLDHDWPEEVYEATEEETGNPARIERGDIALMINPVQGELKGILKTMADKFPGILNLIQSNLEVGNIEFLKNVNKIETSKGHQEEFDTHVYLVPYEINNEGVNDLEGLYQAVVNLRKKLTDQKKKNVYFAVSEEEGGGYMRKLLEIAFRKSGIRVKYLRRSGKRTTSEVRKQTKPTTPKTPVRQPMETIAVKFKGKTYAELLKDMKNRVDIDKLGISVKEIRKGRKDEVRLRIKGDKVAARSLEQEIKAKVKEAEVWTEQKKGVIYVYGIDEVATQEEVMEALNGVNEHDGQPLIRSLWPGKQGSQTAAVEVNKKLANDLIRAGSIKIGWVKCRVRERIEVPRCYNCQDFGHMARDCKGERRSGCLKCGTEGHLAKNCEKEEFCISCGIEGHRSDQTRCPIFSKLVDERRARVETPKRGTVSRKKKVDIK